MNLIGKTTIHPLFFYTGKFSGYFTWVVLILSFCNINLFPVSAFPYSKLLAAILLFVSSIFIVFSMIHLGKSTRLGLPSEDTTLKVNGLYKISRNPMYVGFNLFTISAMISTLNIWIILLGVYSLIIYHFIILGEEKFLEKRFGSDFIAYKNSIRRYL